MTRPIRALPSATVDILLALLDGPAHGFGIKKAIEARTEGRVRMRAATLYEALHRLDRDGLIEEVERSTDDEDGATSRWRFYRMTAAGAEALRCDLARMAALVEHAQRRGLELGDALHGNALRDDALLGAS